MRVQSNLHEIYQALVARLRTELALEESTCFFTTDPRAEPSPSPGSLWLTISPGGGKFDESQFEGAGRHAATAETTFTVHVHSPVQLDQQGHDAQFLMHASLGVLQMIDKVVEALAGEEAVSGANELLREPIFPNGWAEPLRKPGRLGSLGMTFSLAFDWKILP